MIKEATVWNAMHIATMWSKMMQELGEKWDDLNEEEYFINLLVQIKDPQCSVLIACDDNAITGFITGRVEKAQYLNYMVGFCPDLFVEKAYRGKGINDELVEGFVDFCKTQKADKIEFMTLHKKGLIKVWSKKGYKPTHTIYRKSLTKEESIKL